MRILPVFLLCFTAISISSAGQAPHGAFAPSDSAVPVTLGQSVVAVTGPWKFHIGDNPQWADPVFDDSGWQSYLLMPRRSFLTPEEITQSAPLPGWQQHGYPGYTGYAWYRVRLEFSEDVHSPALLMPSNVDDAYEVYVNGAKIGGFGKLDGWHTTYAGQPELFLIPAAAFNRGQLVTLALRFWDQGNEAAPGLRNLAGGLRGVPVIGPAAPLRVFEQSIREQTSQKLSQVQTVMRLAALYVAVGIISLLLFLFSRQQNEYLWAGISMTGFGSMLASIGWVLQATVSVQMSVMGQTVSDAAAIFAMPLAAMYLLNVPSPVWRRANYVVSAVNLAWTLQLAGFSLGLLPPNTAVERLQGITLVLAVLLLACLLLAIAAKGVRKIGSKAWLPMTPGLLFALYCILYALSSLGILKGSFLFANLICACVPISVLVIFLMRFTQQQRENVRMTDDMRQAQEVQHLLIPQHLPSFPGWLIESEYHPARQVGGDFFHILPGGDGSMLIVVGDVSGKGLKAAMTVSAIIGALRDNHERQPARVLAHLNRVLCGQIAGFATCAAILVAEDGSMVSANAGHLPPYRNGEELAVPNGLPLGIIAETNYEERRYELASGDRLTIITDGVIEARNPKGELLGFDRMAGLIKRSAEEIAEAAQRWGQEDDVTVLTIKRAAKLEKVPA